MHRIKSISFSRDGRLHFVASDADADDASHDAIFSVGNVGVSNVDVVAARDDVKWIGDIEVLNNGVVLMRSVVKLCLKFFLVLRTSLLTQNLKY